MRIPRATNANASNSPAPMPNISPSSKKLPSVGSKIKTIPINPIRIPHQILPSILLFSQKIVSMGINKGAVLLRRLALTSGISDTAITKKVKANIPVIPRMT